MSFELGLFILTIMMAGILFVHEWHDKKDSPKLIKFLLIGFLVCAVGSAFFSYRSATNSNDETRRHFDTLLVDLDLARKSLDTANFIISQQDLLAEQLSKANDTIKALQEEKTAQILGGSKPPILLITTQLGEEERGHMKGAEMVLDTSVYFVDVKFEFKNESEYFIKSVVATINGMDYNNLATIRHLPPGALKMMGLLHIDRHNTFYLNTIAPWKSKYFVDRVPFGGRRNYNFNIELEWTNGEYIADIVISSPDANETKELTIEKFRDEKYKLYLSKIDFKVPRGKKLPSHKFKHDDRLTFDFTLN